MRKMLESINILERAIMREMPKCFSSKRLSIFAALFVLVADQLTKFFVVTHVNATWSVTSFLNIVLVKNRGITFGMFENVASPILLIAVAISAIGALIMLVKGHASYYRLPTAIVIAGATGNIIDRILHSVVIDFLDFHLYEYHWPAFNIADAVIVVGVVTLFVISCLEEEENKT